MEISNEKKQIVQSFLGAGRLIGPDALNLVQLPEISELNNSTGDFVVLTAEICGALKTRPGSDINWPELEKSKVFHEKKRTKKQYGVFIEYLSNMPLAPATQTGGVSVVSSYSEKPQKRQMEDFVAIFKNRYLALSKFLKIRQEMKNLTSINRILSKKEKENVSLIGAVVEIQPTKNENLMVTVEDLTGQIKVLINKNKPDLYSHAKDLVCDEVIGVVGTSGDKIVFANSILCPDIPLTRELKKSPDEIYAAFISDLHVGSINFLSREFKKFLRWINGETGTEEQKEIARKTKFVFITGDLVDGVGIYPGQEEELEIKDIEQQYSECANLLKQIPSDKYLIICPGNHDAARIAEPQPPPYKDFACAIYGLPNATLVSNPAIVNIHKTEAFPGFDVLLYHGYSFDYYINKVDSLRLGGGYSRADLVMKFLLKKRHLAPTHTSTLYVPDAEKDPLVIEIVPDFFVTGHLHYSIAANYRNISMIGCSCWQAKTAFQEKMGHDPQPARVPLVNLATRKIKILKFTGE